ncbi:hypothetical protein FVEN_g13122 [Fusarium venenatum]|nr:hypothetical protein FVEN_g13122 [Fusarium venenatum]
MEFTSGILFVTLALVGSSTAQDNGLCIPRPPSTVCSGQFSKTCPWSTGTGVHYACCLETVTCSQA